MASRIGAVLDPVADRIGVVAIVAGFIAAGILPLWVGIVIVVVAVAVAVAVAVRAVLIGRTVPADPDS